MFKISLPVYQTLEATKKKKARVILVGFNWYRNAHHFDKNKIKKHYERLISLKLRGMEYIDGPYITKYVYYYKNKSSDGGNVVSVMEKFFLDAMQAAKVVKEDNVLHHSSDGFRCVEDKNNPRIEIQVYVRNENETS